MKHTKRLAPVMMGATAAAVAALAFAALAQQPPAPDSAKAIPVALAKARPKYPELPPTLPDWEFVQKMALSRFPDANAADVMRFVSENCPAKLRAIKSLAKIRPDDAVERLTDLIYDLLAILALKESNPPLYEIRMRQLKVDSEVDRWVEASRQSSGEAHARDLESLRKAVEQAFDVRQELMKSDVEVLERKLQELKALVARRQESRRAIVAQRVAELAAEEKPLKW
jgi:hypothetical protein